jgi:hypothetical protein
MTCESCRTLVNRWMDTTPSALIPQHGFTFGSGAAHDASGAGLMERRRYRYQQWRETVRFQVGLIRDACRVEGHGE